MYPAGTAMSAATPSASRATSPITREANRWRAIFIAPAQLKAMIERQSPSVNSLGADSADRRRRDHQRQHGLTLIIVLNDQRSGADDRPR